MPAGEMTEARHAEGEEIAPLPEHVAVAEMDPRGIADERVAARHRVPCRHEAVERPSDPLPLGAPVGHRRRCPGLPGIMDKRRVQRELELVDRQTVGLEGQRPLDRPIPALRCLADHA